PKFNEMKGRIHANLLELDSASYHFDKALKQKKTNGTIYIKHPAIAVVENMTKAFVSGDSDKVASYLGIENFKAYYQNFITGFSDIKFTVVDILGQGDKIVKHWNFKGKHTGDFFGMPTTGKSVDIDGVTIAKMKDGKIAQEQDFMDNTVFMQQLGIVSAPENTGIIDNLYKAFGIGDIPSVLAVLDNNVVWNEAEGNAYADGNPYIGPDAVLNGVFARVGSEWDGLN
ncbi:MAG TPA: ester cyclase, partial [Mariniflexile sp.]